MLCVVVATGACKIIEIEILRAFNGFLTQVKFLEEIIALVIDHDEGREVLDLNAPDSLHSQLWIFDDFNLANTVLSQPSGGAAYGS